MSLPQPGEVYRAHRHLYGDETDHIYIKTISPKAFLVCGRGISCHIKNFVILGGKETIDKFTNEYCFLFSEARRESVQRYINTGEVKRFEYSKEQIEKFKKETDKKRSNNLQKKLTLKRVFKYAREAIDLNCEYTGQSIRDAMESIQNLLTRKKGSESLNLIYMEEIINMLMDTVEPENIYESESILDCFDKIEEKLKKKL